MSVQAVLRHRRDTAANWVANNPILEDGQIGFEKDTLKWKFGDGVTAWNDLSHASFPPGDLGDLDNVTETTPSEGDVLEYNGTAWVNVPLPAPAPPAVVTEATTARTATPGNAGEYTRFTHADAKTYTFTDAETYVQGAEYFGRNVGAGDLTLTAVGTITLNAPAGGTLVVPQGGTFSVKMASATEGDVIGYTVAA